VVAILGVLAAVVIPNVGRFIGRGEDEAAATELSNIQSATTAMMTDNGLERLSNYVTSANATDNMSGFPDPSSAAGGQKATDPDGTSYTANDLDGYILYQHDVIADNSSTTDLVNYVANETTKGTYYIDALGTVTQATTGYE
jgi:type II secretory pathway pseudopilin PulG